MKKRIVIVAALCCALGTLSLAACVPSPGEQAETDAATAESNQVMPTIPVGTSIEDTFAIMDEEAEEYAPEIRTLPDGTEVQRTPDAISNGYAWSGGPWAYNNMYLNADGRGCESCHTEGLGDLVMNHLSYNHWPILNGLGSNINVQDCLECHDRTSPIPRSFGSLIHGIHSKANFQGNCMSCHNGTEPGQELTLWDNVKYEELQGITDVENVQGEFSFDQDTIGGDNTILTYWPRLSAFEDGTYDLAYDIQPSDDLFNNWEINFSGTVDNPGTVKLGDLVNNPAVETFTSTIMCVDNGSSAELIANAEVTGIPLYTAMAQAGVNPSADARAFDVIGSDGGSPHWVSMAAVADQQPWIIWEINGERLQPYEGYPCRIWFPGEGAPIFRRWLTDVVFRAEDASMDAWRGQRIDKHGLPYQKAEFTEENAYFTKPAVAICNTPEGEIVPVGQTKEFEGFSYAFDEQIVSIEYSMDNGETWTAFNTPNTDTGKWVYWHFNYTPEEEGAYVLQVRATTAEGHTTLYPDKVMINAKAA